MQSKRLLPALIAAGLMAFALPAVPASADDGISSDGKWYLREYEDNVVSVSCQDKTVTEVTIPSVIDGRTITMVEVDAFKDCESLTKVTVPDTVTVIEDYSFYNCTALEEINIPKNVKNIGFQAFYGCAKLTSMQIPASVEEIEAFAFEGCSALKGVSVAADNANYKDENGILFDKKGEVLYLYPSALEGESYTVPKGCKTVYDYAFIGNPYLKSVDISGISELGEDAFYYCTALESIEVPEGIAELEGSVFGNCNALKSAKLPQSLTAIGESCFYNCLALSDLEIPEGVQTVGNYAFFNCPSLTRVRLTAATTSIGDYAFGWYYSGDTEKPDRLPDFEIDTTNDTAAFDYCVKNSIKCTGGVTQNTVFLYIVVGICALVVIITIVIIVVQKKIQKRYEIG